MGRLVTTMEVLSEKWRSDNPHHCPVVLRDGDGKSVGACWHYLKNGACPTHGTIYLDSEKEGTPLGKRNG